MIITLKPPVISIMRRPAADARRIWRLRPISFHIIHGLRRLLISLRAGVDLWLGKARGSLTDLYFLLLTCPVQLKLLIVSDSKRRQAIAQASLSACLLSGFAPSLCFFAAHYYT